METFNLIANVASIISLLLTVFLTSQIVTIRKKIVDDSRNTAHQSRNRVGGDMAGRDVKRSS